ncbi:putative bifunctional diguanylate cyclase/phosphodiesterase [Thiocystis violacea]|uniref:putative bifunctional diguanylate cyclase/phosphodiesterase n=1 Tax=Thiocystis violacea TaxID=13725 RepID=UPI0019061C66|nr:EAL domain-containing protein [Thiocystis violacea]
MDNDPVRLSEPSSLAPLLRPARAPAAPRMRLSLGAKILVFAVLLAVLPLLASSLSMVSETRDELKSAVNDSLLAEVTQLLDRIQGAMAPAVQILSALGAALADPQLDPETKQAILAAGIRGSDGLEALQLLGEDLRPAFFLAPAFKERLDRAGLAPEQVVGPGAAPLSLGPDAAGVEVMAPFKLAAADLWLVPIATRVQIPGADAGRVLVGYLDVTPLHALLERHAFDANAGRWLLDARGQPLFAFAPQPLVSELMTLLTKAQASGARSLLVTPYRDDAGEDMLGAVGTLEQPRWTLVATLSSREAYGIVRRMLRDLGLWLLLGLTVAVLGALLLAYRISKPIRDMAAVTEQVGGGDFMVRFEGPERCDEIGTLGRRLNQMIEGLAESHRRLDRQAHHDFLTGLPNRRFILKHLQQLVADPQWRQAGVALLFIDLDRFKAVNDSLGHAVGDQLLKMAAKRLVDCVDDVSTVARLGGDEFLIVLCGLREEAAIAAVARALIQAMSEPFHLMDYELYVGGTIGISLVPEEGAEVAELLDMSDMAMYWGKERGRGHFQFFSADLKRRAVRKLALDSQLRKALERDELEVYYQPQVELGHGRIVATEALIRWPDRRGGFVAGPTEFIALAEETGLIVPIGNWVMERVCRQVREWQLAGLPTLDVSINVSAMQFRRQDFFEQVCQTLECANLDARHVGLELTEGVLLEDTERAIRLMSMLKEMGVQIMIDDFGTGYSSLAYLRRFPLDYLKVAQEFVTGIGSNSHDAAIVGAVIALAKSLGLKIIAEGVETGEQLAFLSERDCDLIQGFYFGRPVAAMRFQELVSGEARHQTIMPRARQSGGTG